ncbi:AIR synthase family protein [Salinirubellus sp. GCM10025818]|uniref:AIR synthase family protein n=1 Tax=Salinirubellus TaxID=2162630 RepID=UPI0030CC801E
MGELGKIDRSFFERVIRPNLGAAREDVAVGPSHGVDFGVLDVGGRALVTATDPVSVVPELGFERAGRLAVDIVLADVAVSGVAPSHLAVSLSLPPEMTDEELATTWRGMAGHCRDLGVSVVTGHTARYSGVDYTWVGGATGFGVGSFEDLVRPDGARPGDALVVSTGPAAEVAGLFSTLYGDRLGLPEPTLATARERLDDIEAVRDARTAFEAGEVTAMHDATEGGVVGGLNEMAAGAGVRFDVERASVPLAPGVEAVCGAVDVDPWQVTSCGTLLVAVAPDDAAAVVEALEARGTPAAVVGRVTEGEGVYVDGERAEAPDADPSWGAAADLADRG